MSKLVEKLNLNIISGKLDDRLAELNLMAESNQDGCWGDFGVENAFRSGLPESMVIKGETYHFSFLRVAAMPLSPYAGAESLHLDAVTSSGIVDNVGKINDMILSRVVMNMHTALTRVFRYCTQPPESLEIVGHDFGFRTCSNYDPNLLQTVILAPRVGQNVSAVIIDASRVLHAGVDDENGHRVAAYHRIYQK